MRQPNFLAGLALDRASELRKDPLRLEEEWQRSQARVIPVWNSKHLLVHGDSPQVVFLDTADVQSHIGPTAPRMLLGKSADVTYFALDLSPLANPHETLGLDRGHTFLGLREVAALLPREEGSLLAYANGLMSWDRRHRFCGECGSPTVSTQAGHVRECRGQSCGKLHFPRTDPAVIMLVIDADRCLLGRQPSWPAGVYSTLAGFVEPGESLEEAVIREVREESGVQIKNPRYHSSQPWPFPSSLMLGFTATAVTTEIHLQSDELEDARWFTRDQVRLRQGLKLPSRISIARRLVEEWLADEI